MDIDTAAIRRLRDELLRHASAPGTAPSRERAPGASEAAAMLRRIEPFAETMYVMMIADGERAVVERAALAGALRVLTEDRIDDPGIEELLDRFEANVARGGAAASLARIGARLGGDREDRETAFTLAAVIALADARIEVSENAMLALVQENFGVSDRRAAALLEALD